LEGSEYDSILKYQTLSKDNRFSLDEQFDFAKKALAHAKALKVDSITIKTNHNYSALSIYTGNYEEFKWVNSKTLELATNISDSLALAIANHNLGWYHHLNRVQNDSAYYYYITAYKISEQL